MIDMLVQSVALRIPNSDLSERGHEFRQIRP